MIQGGSSTAQKPKGHVDFKSAFYFQTPVWVAEAPMFLKDTIKLTDNIKSVLNKMKRWNRLTDLEMDLSNNEINDCIYVELVEILSDLDKLS